MLMIQVFQFHKGTIKTLATILPYWALRYFNSIKVRLKRIVPFFTKRLINVFQFHKGTIKTYLQARASFGVLQISIP